MIMDGSKEQKNAPVPGTDAPRVELYAGAAMCQVARDATPPINNRCTIALAHSLGGTPMRQVTIIVFVNRKVGHLMDEK
jgi:hypothetical protein